MVYKRTLGDDFYTLCDLICSCFFEKLLETLLSGLPVLKQSETKSPKPTKPKM